MDKYFKILGIATTNDLTVVKKAYHKKAKLNHPDNGGSPDTMININEAYTIIKSFLKQQHTTNHITECIINLKEWFNGCERFIEVNKIVHAINIPKQVKDGHILRFTGKNKEIIKIQIIINPVYGEYDYYDEYGLWKLIYLYPIDLLLLDYEFLFLDDRIKILTLPKNIEDRDRISVNIDGTTLHIVFILKQYVNIPKETQILLQKINTDLKNQVK